MSDKQEVKSEKEKACQWPGCEQDALCTSGNFNGKLVCDEHFDLTNGSTIIDLIQQEDYWDELEDSLSQFKSQKLLIDEFEVALSLEHIDKLKLAIAVYVNGKINFRWTNDESDNPIPEKFWWERTKRVYSKKAWKTLKKIWTAEEMKSKKEKVSYYSPYFKSFRTLKRSFKRNNESIKWLKNVD